jgi:hypothetical protein
VVRKKELTMITTRYVAEKVPPPQVDLDRVLAEYHRVLTTLRELHNKQFAPYKPFS